MRKEQFIVWAVLWLTIPLIGHSQEPKPAAMSADSPSDAAPVRRFDIWEYRVEGNTVLNRQDVEQAVYPYLGKGKSLQDIEMARNALARRYHDAGYVTVVVDIPPQKVDNGVVHLRVTEGKVESLVVSGSRYFSLRRIRNGVPALAEGMIPHLPAANVQLKTLNSKLSDRSIAPVLRPGRAPGTVEVDLKVKDELPLHGSLDVNDRYSIGTSHLRLSAMLRYDNLWQKEHSLSVQYQGSPEKPSEVKVWSGTYLARSDESKNILAVYGVSSSSDTATVGTLAVIGNGNIIGARWIKPLDGAQDYSHSLTLGVDYKDFKESIVLQGADSLNTPISYMPFVIQYSGTRHGDSGTSQYGFGFHFGVRGLQNDPAEFENKRFNARPNYMFLRASVERRQRLYRGTYMRVRLDGQLTDSPLISSEQYSAGGVDSVRGYHESERLGDDAVHGTLELSTPSLNRGGLQELRALVFVDGAALRVRDHLPGQGSHYELSSAGIGLRLRAWRYLTATLDWAQVFQATDAVADGEQRLHFDVECFF